VSKSAIPLNAGQPLPSREEADAKADEARAMADARKKQAEAVRNTSGIEESPVMPVEVIPSESQEPLVGVELGDNDTDSDKDIEIAMLKSKIAELEAANKNPVAVRRPVTQKVPVEA
jgi:hypothetical protein